MTILAVSLPGTLASPQIFLLSNRLKVTGTTTGTDAAQVIDLKFFWDSAIDGFVGKSMHEKCRATDANNSISDGGNRAAPQPTTSLVNWDDVFGEKSEDLIPCPGILLLELSDVMEVAQSYRLDPAAGFLFASIYAANRVARFFRSPRAVVVMLAERFCVDKTNATFCGASCFFWSDGAIVRHLSLLARLGSKARMLITSLASFFYTRHTHISKVIPAYMGEGMDRGIELTLRWNHGMTPGEKYAKHLQELRIELETAEAARITILGQLDELKAQIEAAPPAVRQALGWAPPRKNRKEA